MLLWSVWFCWLYNYAMNTAILILFIPTVRLANVFHNHLFVKVKILAFAVVFEFQIKAESKEFQLRLFDNDAVVQLPKICWCF